ncbi:MAG: hypothetical protein CME19_00450 [Gemmatimonadetes bacterium]|nr:hypothetical protein [Gemmatimonadota bacterium]
MSLRRNVVYLTLEKVVHTLGGLLGMVLVARELGPGALGDYGFAISLTAFFVPVLDLGMNNRLIKSVAGGARVSDVLNEVLSYKLTVAPAVFFLMVVAGWVWGGVHLALPVLLIGASTIFMSAGDGGNAVFKGLQQAHLSFLVIGVLNVALLVGLVVALHSGGGLVEVGWCYAVTRCGYAVMCLALLKRKCPDFRVSAKLGVDLNTMWSGLLHLPGVYYLGNLLYLSYLATYVMSPVAAGVFYIGYRAAAATYVLVSAGFEAVLAHAVSDGRRHTGLGVWFVTYGIIALLLLFLAAPLVVTVFGNDFGGSVRAIRLLASCVPPFALCGLAHTLLMAAHREQFAFLVMAVLLVAGFGMAIVAEATFGTESTALVPAVSATLAIVVLWFSLYRQTRPA